MNQNVKRSPRIDAPNVVVHLKTRLKAVGKVVDNACTFLLGDSRPRWGGICCPTVFIRAMSFQVFKQLENLTPIWKFVEIEFSSVLNNLEGLTFVFVYMRVG